MSEPIQYCYLSVGDKFTLNCKYTEAKTSFGTRRIKGDKRVFVKDEEGATEIIDCYGKKTNWKCYPYLTMKVYRYGGGAE